MKPNVGDVKLASGFEYRHIPENAHFCKSMTVAETGSSDSVTLGLLVASLEALFYQRMATPPKKPELSMIDRAYRTNRGVTSP